MATCTGGSCRQGREPCATPWLCGVYEFPPEEEFSRDEAFGWVHAGFAIFWAVVAAVFVIFTIYKVAPVLVALWS